LTRRLRSGIERAGGEDGASMKICVYGAGAVGGHLAARLARAGNQVSVVARGAHLAAMRARGLTLILGGEKLTAPVRAAEDPAELGPQDAVIVTTKAPSLGAIAGKLPALFGPDTPVVFALNGIPWWYFHGVAMRPKRPDLGFLDPDGALARQVGLERVVGCVIYSANAVIEPGVIQSNSADNSFVLGEPDGTLTPRIKSLSEVIKAAGLGAPVRQDIRRELWSKLLNNAAQAPICCLLERDLSVIGVPDLLALAKNVMREAIAAARSDGIELGDDVDQRFGFVKSGSKHKPSMLQDLELRRAMEIDVILVAIQRFAQAAGIPSPHLDSVTALLIEKARALGCY
jgi:2-dehydropantoate 2-reductase